MLLTENRVSQVKEKYNIPSQVWEPMVTGSAAIAKNQKYLDWIAKQWEGMVSTPSKVQQQRIEGNVWTGTLNGLLTTIEAFDRVRPNLKKKDLYQYRDRQEVIDSLEDYKLDKTRNIETHKESEVVYEDNRFKVVVPQSHTASCYYGAGTKWCTASTDNPGHFTNYDREGKLFYILDKSAPTSDKHYKVALNKTYKGGETFYDAEDSPIPDPEDINKIILHPEVINKINEYFTFSYKDEIAKISEEEKQKELDRIAREAEWAARRRERERRLELSANERKENGEWSYEEGDEDSLDLIALMANVLMEYLKDENEFDEKKTELFDVQYSIDEMRLEMDEDPEVIANPNGERAQDYGQDLNNLEEELELLKEEAHDVYDIRWDEYYHYGLPVFEYEGAEYAVGTDEEADKAAEEQVDAMIDDIGYAGFAEGFAEWYIDAEAVADDYEDYFYDQVSDAPEDYLDEENDVELTFYSKSEIQKIDEHIGNFREELEETDDELMREEIEDKIEYLETEKEEILEDNDNYEYTEQAKDDYVGTLMDEVRDDPLSFLRDYGADTSEQLERYVDKAKFIEGVIESDGRGNGLSGYDGNENEVQFDGEWYYIYRIN